MDADLRRATARHARRHHGVVTREYLLALGVTGRAIDWAIEAGDLVVLFPGVYRLAGVPDTWRARALAAVRRIERQSRRRRGDGTRGPSVALAGPAAAHLHGLPGFARAPSLLVVSSARIRCKDVAVAHRAALTPADVDEVDRIPVVSLAWTVVDLAATATSGPGQDALAHVLGTGRCRPGQLLGPAHRTIELPGRARVARQIRGITGPVDHLRSHTEGRVADACVAAGLPRPAANRRVRTSAGGVHELDLAWLDERVDVEVDGPHHLLPDQRRRDRQRDRELRADTWEVVRVPVEEVDEDLADVVRRIRAAVETRSRG